MKEVAGLDQELTIEERNLLSVAYKNIIVSFLYPFQIGGLGPKVPACLVDPTLFGAKKASTGRANPAIGA